MRPVADITVFSTLAIKEAYLALAPQFESARGHRLVTSWMGMVDILKHIKAGEVADLVIASAMTVDDLARAGKIPGERRDIARSGVAVAVRAGAPKPDIGSAEAVKRALLRARSIAYSSGPSGVYLSQLFERWGVAQELKSRITQTPPGSAVGPLVARGEAEIGFQQMSELLPIPGIDIVGPLPPEIQTITVFSGGIPASAKHAEAAREFLEYLRSPAAVPVLKQKGMESAAR